MSAAGIAYLVAKALDSTNIDLAKLAVIGNVGGDMMARENCGLVGPAREIVQDGVEYGNILVRGGRDLNCYGTSTRPLHVCLGYCDDPLYRRDLEQHERSTPVPRAARRRTEEPAGGRVARLGRTPVRGPAHDHQRPCPATHRPREGDRPPARRDLHLPRRTGADAAPERLRVRHPPERLRPVGKTPDREQHLPRGARGGGLSRR